MSKRAATDSQQVRGGESRGISTRQISGARRLRTPPGPSRSLRPHRV